jgi:hypothetical protein
VTIARRRATTFNTVAAPIPNPVPTHAPPPGAGVPLPMGDVPAPEVITPVGRLRRCTFRRVDRVTALPNRPQLPTYEVMCLLGDRDEPMALGDIEAARSICEACVAVGIFRPDED